jgi:hypothetical protein
MSENCSHKACKYHDIRSEEHCAAATSEEQVAEGCPYHRLAHKAAQERIASLERQLAELREEKAVLEEVGHWAQALLTALNVGDVKCESPLHRQLRKVMITYRVVTGKILDCSEAELRSMLGDDKFEELACKGNAACIAALDAARKEG